MHSPPQLGAGKLIVVGATMAILLLWLDSASSSVPTMVAIAVGALVVFIYLRNANSSSLTPAQRLEQERRDALQWLAKSDAANGGVADEDE